MSLPPGFIAVHGNHPEQLRQAVVEFSRRQPLAPLESKSSLCKAMERPSGYVLRWQRTPIEAAWV